MRRKVVESSLFGDEVEGGGPLDTTGEDTKTTTKDKTQRQNEVESSGPLDTTKAAPLTPPANGGWL